MKSKAVPIPPLWLVSAALMVAAVVFCIRSRWRTDILAFFPPSARLQAMVTARQGLVVVTSDVPFDPRYGCTCNTISASAEEFDPVRDDTIGQRSLIPTSAISNHTSSFQGA